MNIFSNLFLINSKFSDKVQKKLYDLSEMAKANYYDGVDGYDIGHVTCEDIQFSLSCNENTCEYVQRELARSSLVFASYIRENNKNPCEYVTNL